MKLMEELPEAINKIKRGEKELRNGKTKVVRSLAEIRVYEKPRRLLI
jgi:hypothetical protein